MTLSRRYLEEGQMRALYIAAVDDKRALTDEQLSALLTATLARKPKGAGWWVFAYGSLLWNPLFPVAEARAGSVHGLHRRFCLRSVASRGTVERPGLVLALEPGGECHGVVYRLPSPLALDELHLLFRRELVVGAYHPRWIQVRSAERRLRPMFPSRRMSAGTRSSAITAQAPASSAIFASAGVTTSMITPPLSISARPVFSRNVARSVIEPILRARA